MPPSVSLTYLIPPVNPGVIVDPRLKLPRSGSTTPSRIGVPVAGAAEPVEPVDPPAVAGAAVVAEPAARAVVDELDDFDDEPQAASSEVIATAALNTTAGWPRPRRRCRTGGPAGSRFGSPL